MRHLVTLSDIPEEMHAWLKQEAARLGEKTGRRVHIYQVVHIAVNEYKSRVEAEARSEREVASATN